jgi:hypothetical protein
MLSRDAILHGLTFRAEQDVDVPMLGGTVHIRELSRAEYQAAVALLRNQDDDERNHHFNMAIVAAGLVDPATKQPWFSYDELSRMNGTMRAATVLDVAQRILALSEVGPDALKSGDSAPDQGRRARSDR